MFSHRARHNDMAPNTIHSAYRRYKQDTDSVASWLASTAKKNGYPTDLLRPHDPAAQPAGRLKGKARKLAREAAQSSPSKEAPDTNEEEKKKKPTYIIALSDFVQLANFLATRTPRVVVPKAFTTTLSRLIYQRRAFANLLRKHGQSSDANSAKTHGHFVTILETVRNLLCPLEGRVSPRSDPSSNAGEGTPAAPNGSSSGSPPPTHDPLRGLGNRFANLSVDEPSQSFLDAFAQESAPVERPIAPEDDPVIYEAEPQTSLEDAFFVYFALVDDLHNIRQDIRSLWVHHLEGLDIAAVAVATNVALSVARGLVQEAMPMLKTITDTFKGGFLGAALAFLVKGCVDEKESNATQSFDFDPRFNELWDRALISMLRLYKIIPVKCTWRSPEFVAGKIPDHLSEDGWDLKTEDQKLHECGQIVMQHASDMSAVIAAIPVFPLEDEILRGLREFQETGEAPLHLAFSSQVLVDIHVVLKGRIRDTFSRVKAEMDAMTKEVLPDLQSLIDAGHGNNRGSNVDLVYLFGIVLSMLPG
jgi:hypothetical protein